MYSMLRHCMDMERMNKSGGASLILVNKTNPRWKGAQVSRRHEVMSSVRMAFFG